MLVLSRKVGQTIVIDDKITIVVHRVSGNRVSIAIEAPEDVHILRGELDEVRGEFARDSETAGPLAHLLADAKVGDSVAVPS